MNDARSRRLARRRRASPAPSSGRDRRAARSIVLLGAVLPGVILIPNGVLLGLVSALTILLEGLGGLALPACGWDVR